MVSLAKGAEHIPITRDRDMNARVTRQSVLAQRDNKDCVMGVSCHVDSA